MEGQKLGFWVHFSTYSGVTRRWYNHVPGNDVTWQEVTGAGREVT